MTTLRSRWWSRFKPIKIKWTILMKSDGWQTKNWAKNNRFLSYEPNPFRFCREIVKNHENHFKNSRCAKSCLDKNLWGYVWILILLNHGQVWPEKNTIMFGLVRKMFVCVRYVMKCSHRVLEFLRVLLTEFNCVRFLNIKHQYHVICQKSSNCRQSSLGYYVRIYRKCKVYFFFHRFVSKSKTVLEWSF